MWPHGLFAVAASLALLVRANDRGRPGFTAIVLARAAAGGVAYVWRFYRKLPTRGLPVLLRVAVSDGSIPGFAPHLSVRRAVAPVTPVVIMPHGVGLGMAGRSEVFLVRDHGIALEVEATRRGRIGRASLVAERGVVPVPAAGNLRHALAEWVHVVA